MKSKIILLLCLMLLTLKSVPITQAQIPPCTDADAIARLIDQLITLTDLQTRIDDPSRAAQIETLKASLLELKNCYPGTTAAPAETDGSLPTPTPTPPPLSDTTPYVIPNANPAVRWLSEEKIEGFPVPALNGTATTLYRCTRVVALSQEGNATQVTFNDIFEDKSEAGWVYADWFPGAFQGRQYSGPQVTIYDAADANASPIVVDWQNYPTITLSEGPLVEVAEASFPARARSWVHFPMLDGGEGYVPPRFFSALLLNQLITTQRETSPVYAEPKFDASVTTSVLKNRMLYVFGISPDGGWLHVNPQKPIWINNSKLIPRVFTVGQTISMTASLFYRKDPNDQAEKVLPEIIKPGPEFTVQQVTTDNAWVRVNYAAKDGSPLTGWLNTCGVK